MPPIGSERLTRQLGASLLALVVVPAACAAWYLHRQSSQRPEGREADEEPEEEGEDEGYVPVTTYESLIGNTPMIELRTASALTGCRILVKMESMNPGGTGKDRAARAMLREALEAGRRRGRGLGAGPKGASGSDSSGTRSSSNGSTSSSPLPASRADPPRVQPLRRGGHVVEGTSGR
jgi:hypothetical protein